MKIQINTEVQPSLSAKAVRVPDEFVLACADGFSWWQVLDQKAIIKDQNKYNFGRTPQLFVLKSEDGQSIKVFKRPEAIEYLIYLNLEGKVMKMPESFYPYLVEFLKTSHCNRLEYINASQAEIPIPALKKFFTENDLCHGQKDRPKYSLILPSQPGITYNLYPKGFVIRPSIFSANHVGATEAWDDERDAKVITVKDGKVVKEVTLQTEMGVLEEDFLLEVFNVPKTASLDLAILAGIFDKERFARLSEQMKALAFEGAADVVVKEKNYLILKYKETNPALSGLGSFVLESLDEAVLYTGGGSNTLLCTAKNKEFTYVYAVRKTQKEMLQVLKDLKYSVKNLEESQIDLITSEIKPIPKYVDKSPQQLLQKPIDYTNCPGNLIKALENLQLLNHLEYKLIKNRNTLQDLIEIAKEADVGDVATVLKANKLSLGRSTSNEYIESVIVLSLMRNKASSKEFFIFGNRKLFYHYLTGASTVLKSFAYRRLEADDKPAVKYALEFFSKCLPRLFPLTQVEKTKLLSDLNVTKAVRSKLEDF